MELTDEEEKMNPPDKSSSQKKNSAWSMVTYGI